MGRAKEALRSLPWVDQKTVSADVKKQEVRFGVNDMTKFDESQLKDAFKNNGFDAIAVLDKPKA